LVVQVARLQDGARRIMSIAEVVRAHEDQVELQEIFVFERTGVTDQGKVKGRFRGTGIRPKILERLRVSGINLPESVFGETMGVNL
jgi:pilus assembly protein CpaF